MRLKIGDVVKASGDGTFGIVRDVGFPNLVRIQWLCAIPWLTKWEIDAGNDSWRLLE